MMNAREDREDATVHCCAECGKEEGDGISLKTCKSCKLVKYCNAMCQRNHWPTHKKPCKHRASELHDEALFKDPPSKEDCPICFLPMPMRLLCCVSLPDATLSSVPIHDFAKANKEMDGKATETYYPCCGKKICQGCLYSFCMSGNEGKCPFCNTNRGSKTEEEQVTDNMKRVEANDPASICMLANAYNRGLGIFQQDRTKAKELYTRAAELGSCHGHHNLGMYYYEEGDMKKAKFHNEIAAMAGHEEARYNLGVMEGKMLNLPRAKKHLTIAASAGSYLAMHALVTLFEPGVDNRADIDSILLAYNKSCAEMRSEARDNSIRAITNKYALPNLA